MDFDKLKKIEKEIINILSTEVKDIIFETRKNMVVVEEKPDGDSATIADIKIGKLFEEILPRLLPDSVVIQEESFNKSMYEKSFKSQYIWVLDPIDGTKAFRDLNNKEWCVGLCLLDNLTPILSFVYLVEDWLGRDYLISANKYEDGLLNYGEKIEFNKSKESKYVSHIQKDNERNCIENKIAEIFPDNEIIRAHAGHSTLAQFARVVIDGNRVFTRRSANVWDIIQSAYLIEKNGGEVFYDNGKSIFPLDPKLLKCEDSHLTMPFTIACSIENKEKIIKNIIN